MPRPCNALPSACTSARRSQRSSRFWTRSSTAWLSGYARAKHSVSCSELSSLPLRQRAPPQARRSHSRSEAASGPKVSRSLARRRMARTRWETRPVLLTRASLFASDAVLLRNHVAHRSGMIPSFGVAEDAAAQRKVDFSLARHLQCNKNGSLFNHLVGTSEQRRWNNNAKGFGGLQVDNKLER